MKVKGSVLRHTVRLVWLNAAPTLHLDLADFVGGVQDLAKAFAPRSCPLQVCQLEMKQSPFASYLQTARHRYMRHALGLLDRKVARQEDLISASARSPTSDMGALSKRNFLRILKISFMRLRADIPV